MRLAVAGGTGFIGSALCARLLEAGHFLTLLTRRPAPLTISPNKKWQTWDGTSPGSWEAALEGIDGVINLAGEPLAEKRWSEEQKKKIRDSRIDSTRALVTAISKARQKPKFLLNGSAIGYYGSHGNEALTEAAQAGDDFLARVCREWEAQAEKAENYGLRVIRLRTGIVLGESGGVLAKMLLPFKLFVGGPPGGGSQWMSWIHLEDEIGLIEFLIANGGAKGAVNATAPNPVIMKEFCSTLGKVLRRPSWAPVPAFALRLVLGEMSDMLLTGQRVLPERAQKLGYSFRYSDVYQALKACMRKE